MVFLKHEWWNLPPPHISFKLPDFYGWGAQNFRICLHLFEALVALYEKGKNPLMCKTTGGRSAPTAKTAGEATCTSRSSRGMRSCMTPIDAPKIVKKRGISYSSNSIAQKMYPCQSHLLLRVILRRGL